MSTTTRSRARALLAAALCLAASGLAAPTRAQSLADVAKKEEERRQKVGEPTKVYTNKDLKTAGGATTVAAPVPDMPPAADPAKTGDAAKDAAGGGKTKAKDAAEKDPAKDPAYWSGRLKALQAQLDRDQTFFDAMQSRINALTTDAVNRDDPIQRGRLERDRQKALADLAGLTKAIDTDKKSIAAFQEEARRAGIPPGWLR